ncbi:MAG: TrmH family RNA methyltransferase [Bacteroidia bacterium]|nr:MAG: TrmH family RNA methyltransferase [Bacteroidia bacterium]
MRKLKVSELERKSIEEFREAEKSPFVIVLDNVRSLNNIGSVFRTADGFMAESVILCGITAKPPHPEIHKTALGATDSVSWSYFEDTTVAINELRKKGYKIISVEQVDTSVKLQDFVPETGLRYALVFGHEVKGVSEEVVGMSDLSVEIPQYGTKHSFNIAVSAGIVMWDIFRKVRLL